MRRSRQLLLLAALLACGCELIGGIDDRQLLPANGGSPGAGGGGGGGAPGGAGGVQEGGQGGSCDTSSTSTCCGALGHDCLGGDCVDGACQPVLVGQPFSPTSLAVAGPYVYWSVSLGGAAEVQLCPKAGCENDEFETLKGGFLDISRLAVGADTVFMIQSFMDGAIRGCQTGTPDCNQFVFAAEGLHGPAAMAIDEATNTAYFSTLGDEVDTSGAIFRCPANDCFEPFAIYPARATALAHFGIHIYWMDDENHNVRRCNVSSCAPSIKEVTNTGNAGGSHLDVTNGFVTFAGIDNNLSRCEIQADGTCGAITTLAGTGASVAAFVVDETFAYYVEKSHEPTSIWRVPLAGGPPEEIASGQVDIIELVQDNESIYWLESGEAVQGVIRRVAKPP